MRYCSKNEATGEAWGHSGRGNKFGRLFYRGHDQNLARCKVWWNDQYLNLGPSLNNWRSSLGAWVPAAIYDRMICEARWDTALWKTLLNRMLNAGPHSSKSMDTFSIVPCQFYKRTWVYWSSNVFSILWPCNQLGEVKQFPSLSRAQILYEIIRLLDIVDMWSVFDSNPTR
jgi:hypothetical protein